MLVKDIQVSENVAATRLITNGRSSDSHANTSQKAASLHPCTENLKATAVVDTVIREGRQYH